MHDFSKVVGVIAIIIGILVSMTNGKLPSPTPDAPDSGVAVPKELNDELDLAFQADRESAVKWAGLLAGIARFIEADGDTSSPMVKTLYDVDQVRSRAIAAPVEPIRGGDAVGKSLAPRLAMLGAGPEKMDDSLRSRVVELFLQASEALKN